MILILPWRSYVHVNPWIYKDKGKSELAVQTQEGKILIHKQGVQHKNTKGTILCRERRCDCSFGHMIAPIQHGFRFKYDRSSNMIDARKLVWGKYFLSTLVVLFPPTTGFCNYMSFKIVFFVWKYVKKNLFFRFYFLDSSNKKQNLHSVIYPEL
jgi:hypothetical protein